MKKITLIAIISLILVPAFLSASFVYLDEDDYKKLSRSEREAYWNTLESELIARQERKANAIAEAEKYRGEIDELEKQIEQVDAEYQIVYNRIMSRLEVAEQDLPQTQRKLEQYKRDLQRWDQLSDSELWERRKEVQRLMAEIKEFKQSDEAKAPDFRDDIADLDRRLQNIERSLEQARPKYYEDTYTTVKGDFLYKIAGYSFIYDDSSKWPIIFRANRDQIRDPNIIRPDQVLKIPRGLPTSWKVYKGEFLWRIASYPEIYGDGAKWPVIYRANKDQIKDPDLIYPNQIFVIPRD